MAKSCWITAAVVAIYLINTVKSQLDPEIVDEIGAEVALQGGQAKLNCTVVNKQGGDTVVWTFLGSNSGGEIISSDENIFVENKTCEEDNNNYEVVKREFDRRITYMLEINCLEVVDSGNYKCYIQIRGSSPATWPSKIGHLTVQETTECQGDNCPSSEAKGASAISVLLLATVAMVTLAKLMLL